MLAKISATVGRRIILWVAAAVAAEVARRLVDRVLPAASEPPPAER